MLNVEAVYTHAVIDMGCGASSQNHGNGGGVATTSEPLTLGRSSSAFRAPHNPRRLQDTEIGLDDFTQDLSKLRSLDPSTSGLLVLSKLQKRLGALRADCVLLESQDHITSPELEDQLERLIPVLLSASVQYARMAGSQTPRLVWLQSCAAQALLLLHLLPEPNTDRASKRSDWLQETEKLRKSCASSLRRQLSHRARGASPSLIELKLTQAHIAAIHLPISKASAARQGVGAAANLVVGVVKSVLTSKPDSQLVKGLSQAFTMTADAARRSMTNQAFLELAVLHGATEDIREDEDPQALRQRLVQAQALHFSFDANGELIPKGGRWEPKAALALLMAEAAVQIVIKEKPGDEGALSVLKSICLGDSELSGLSVLLKFGNSGAEGQMDPAKGAAVALTNWARRLLLEKIKDHDLLTAEAAGPSDPAVGSGGEGGEVEHSEEDSSDAIGQSVFSWSPSDGFKILEDHLQQSAAEWNSKLRQAAADMSRCQKELSDRLPAAGAASVANSKPLPLTSEERTLANESVAAVEASVEVFQGSLRGMAAAAESTGKLLQKAIRLFRGICSPQTLVASRASREGTLRDLMLVLLRGRVEEVLLEVCDGAAAAGAADTSSPSVLISEDMLLQFLDKRCQSYMASSQPPTAPSKEQPPTAPSKEQPPTAPSKEQVAHHQRLQLQAVASRLSGDWKRGIALSQSLVLSTTVPSKLRNKPSYRWTLLADLCVQVEASIEAALLDTLEELDSGAGCEGGTDMLAPMFSEKVVSHLKSKNPEDSNSPGVMEMAAHALEELKAYLSESAGLEDSKTPLLELLAHMAASASLMVRLANKAKDCEEMLGRNLAKKASEVCEELSSRSKTNPDGGEDLHTRLQELQEGLAQVAEVLKDDLGMEDSSTNESQRHQRRLKRHRRMSKTDSADQDSAAGHPRRFGRTISMVKGAVGTPVAASDGLATLCADLVGVEAFAASLRRLREAGSLDRAWRRALLDLQGKAAVVREGTNAVADGVKEVLEEAKKEVQKSVEDLKLSAVEWLEGIADKVTSSAGQVAEMVSGSINEAALGFLSDTFALVADPASGLLGEALRAFGASRSSACEKHVREVAAVGILMVLDALHRSLSSGPQDPLLTGQDTQEKKQGILQSLQKHVLWGQSFDPANTVRSVLMDSGAMAQELNSLYFAKPVIKTEDDREAEAEAEKMHASMAWQDSEPAVKAEVTRQLAALEKLQKDVEAETDPLQKHVLLVKSRQSLAVLRQVSHNVKDVATLAGVMVGFLTAIDTKLDVISHKLDALQQEVTALRADLARLVGKPVLDELREQMMLRVEKREALRTKVYIPVKGLEKNEEGKFAVKEGEEPLNLQKFVIEEFILGESRKGENPAEYATTEVLLLAGAAGD